MKRKILFIGIGIFAVGFIFYFLTWSFAPRSYARAETYDRNISEKNLIEILNEVKAENNLNTNSFSDHKKGHWNSIYFEYKDKNQIIHILTRPVTKTKTTFYFSGCKNKLDVGNWTDANEYFWWWKNSKAKQEFEKRILEKIKEKIKNESPTNRNKA